MSAIFIYKDGLQTGPFDEPTVIGYLQKGNLSLNDMAFREDMTEWKPLYNLFPNTVQSQTTVTAPRKSISGVVGILLSVGGAFLMLLSVIAFLWAGNYRNTHFLQAGLSGLMGQSDFIFQLAEVLMIASPVGFIIGLVLFIVGVIMVVIRKT